MSCFRPVQFWQASLPNTHSARQHINSGATVQSSFFMPHVNETGYWWQEENARLASLTAAMLIGGRKVRPSGGGLLGLPDELAHYASRQLDWILGSNPFDICFLEGFGSKHSPPFCNARTGGTLTGGIANGITGQNEDGTGIAWPLTAQEECWNDWRWNEQWLPHSAWYLLAITAMAL